MIRIYAYEINVLVGNSTVDDSIAPQKQGTLESKENRAYLTLSPMECSQGGE